MEHTITHATVKAYVLGGHGTLTIESPATGTRFTYRTHRPGPDAPIFVSVLTGPNNESDYRYLGAIFQDRDFVITKASKIGRDAPSAKAWSWFWQRLTVGVLPDALNVYHHGKCGRCGRKLTVPESIETGIGPVCAMKE